jgi:hypothetical protein
MVVSSLIFIFLSSTRFILNSPSFEFGGVVAGLAELAGLVGLAGLAGLAGLTGLAELAELDVFF